MACSLGMECELHGVCYAEAHGHPGECGLPCRELWDRTVARGLPPGAPMRLAPTPNDPTPRSAPPRRNPRIR